MDSSSSSTTEQTGPAYPTSPVWDFSDLKNELLCRVDPSRRSKSPTPDVRGPEHLPHEPDTSPPPSQLSKAKGFAKLPAELCIKILGYLPIEAKLTGMRVCKEWSVNMMERSVWESFDLEGFTMTDSNRCLLSILERALKHAHGNLKHMVLPHAALPFVLERALFDYLAGCDVRYEDVTPIWGDIMPNLESLTFGGRSEDFQRLLYPHLARMTSLKALHILSPASESFPGTFNGIRWPSGHLSLSLRRLSIHVCPGIFTYQKWPWQDLIEELEYYGTGGSICIVSLLGSENQRTTNTNVKTIGKYRHLFSSIESAQDCRLHNPFKGLGRILSVLFVLLRSYAQHASSVRLESL